MEVTVNCPCGEAYVFEIEPVNGQMPTGVNCPSCGADGTDLSNQFLAEQDHTSSSKPSLRLQREEAPPEPAPEDLSFESTEPFSGSAHGLREDIPQASLLLGTLGAVIAGAIGMGAWYALIKVTGYELGIAAWAIGAFIGFVTLRLAKGGSNSLGLIAGGCALVAITGGQLLVTKTYMDEFLDEYLPTAYDEQMNFALGAVAAEGDEELRAFLAISFAEWGVEPDASQITDESLAAFRSDDLPHLQAFINGTPSQEEFEKSIRAEYQSPETKLAVMKESFSLFTLLWLLLGVGSAYRLGRGGDGA